MSQAHPVRTRPPKPRSRWPRIARIQSLPGQFETTNATAGRDEPTSSSTTARSTTTPNFPPRTSPLPPQDVERVAKADVHPDHLIIVAVGDRAKIEPALKELNLAPIEYVDTSGNPIK